MKNILLFSFFLATFLSLGCEKTVSENVIIKGTGPIKTEMRMTPVFTSVENRIGCNINFIKSNSRSIEITANSNLLPYLHTNVINGKLIITSGDFTLQADSAIHFDIYLPSIDELLVSGSGIVESDCPIQRIFLTGSGNISCTGKTDVSYVNMSGSGIINLLGMTSKRTNISLSGTGNIKLNVTERLEISISGTGNVYYKGKPQIERNISGVGNVVDVN
ncbi:MAG: DUF2807 domain-containing protein [Bacteroidales bacterium]|nr:DUF2807 domain-containing protein [Bacteroidales bacterium]